MWDIASIGRVVGMYVHEPKLYGYDGHGRYEDENSSQGWGVAPATNQFLPRHERTLIDSQSSRNVLWSLLPRYACAFLLQPLGRLS